MAASSAAAIPTKRIVTELFAMVKPWRKWLILIAFLVLATSLLELVPPLLIRSIIDNHLTVARREGLLSLALLYLAATASVQAITASNGYLVATVAQKLLYTIRVRLFSHLQRLPMTYYDHTPLGDIISRATADVETIDVVFTSGVSTLVANLFRLVTVAIAMLIMSPILSIAAVIVVPPLAIITRYFQVRIRQAEQANRRAIGLMNTHLQESLRGMEVIQSFRKENAFITRFRHVLRAVLNANNSSTKFSALYPPVTAILSALAVAFLLWAGTRDFLAGFGISVGTLTAFVLLLQQFIAPVTALGDEWQTVQGALSGAERILSVLTEPPDEVTEKPMDGKAKDNGGIVCQDVVFGYLPDQPVLQGMSLRVEPGEHVALVGRTGAGKTSLVHLLAGLYVPWSGSVTAAGQDPRSIPVDERRSVVGVVPQVLHLFSGTVLDNLTLKDPSVHESAVKEAATLSGADAFIMGLPQGYQTKLSGVGRGSGTQLSSGQQQLLALARALVWKPEVLLLDEATSSVDGASEAALRSSIRERVLKSGTAVLTVAHRLSTACEADRVIVIEAGRIIEEGSPAELAQRGGRFAALLELEAAGWDWRTIS
ncbi:MAG: multidrug ABC transporter ATP-binding protein [Chloroflexi bacterium RBG_16_51_9]|nr:MAG: multidrug ABC transporter ATP-binding protein [Chloroflexi bacterium RBG_16_51_9]